ncbi:MAG: outer membrane beta-barrel protein [Alistipes sp.]|nr:outer membrane beta-barrel protein [Alistipes sp.]
MVRKLLVLSVFFLLCCLPRAAQAQLGRGELSVGYGFSPVTNWIDAYSDKLLGVLDMRDASMDSWGGVSVNYSFRIIGGLGVGGTFVYSGNKQRHEGQKITTNYYSVLPHLKMRWLNLRIFSIYSRVGVGLTFPRSSGEGERWTARQLAFQVSPLGVELGGKLALYAEAGVGTTGSLVAGMRFRF